MTEEKLTPASDAAPNHPHDPDYMVVSEFAPWRQSLDRSGRRLVDWLGWGLARHWLFGVNVIIALYALTPFLAPILMNLGQTGLAGAIYEFYSYSCHQLKERSFFIFGYKMAYCERDTAIYLAALMAGIVFGIRHERWRWKKTPLRVYLLFLIPIAVDGFTQLFGFRESTAILRVVTGSLFGAASLWFVLPHIQEAADEIIRPTDSEAIIRSEPIPLNSPPRQP